jgi:uncharacterized protein
MMQPPTDAKRPAGVISLTAVWGHDAVLLRIFISADDRYGAEESLYHAIVLKAREMNLAGATVLKGPLGFGRSSRLHQTHVMGADERPVVIEICDAEEKIEAFLPVFDEMMESGLVTLEKARVLQYGRKRSGYLERLTKGLLQRLHIEQTPRHNEIDPPVSEGTHPI